jgi:glycerol-3-phosphate O-acyltransferase
VNVSALQGLYAQLAALETAGTIPQEHVDALRAFALSYLETTQQGGASVASSIKQLELLAQTITQQLKAPYLFSNLHHRVREPFDYYQFGIDFSALLIDRARSTTFHAEQLSALEQQIANGDNVIFLANHQTEADAQILHYMLQDSCPTLVEHLFFVAGHRVVTDPWAIPFSLGCNLLCIWSKKYVELSPANKQSKLEHNRRTIRAMQQLLDQGGAAIYVAPSGGRDRPDASGTVSVAAFDTQSVELFLLAARHSKRPTHIYPLALATYAMLPPPATIQHNLGEPRRVAWTPIHLALGEEWLDCAPLPADQRTTRAEILWQHVQLLYSRITS